MAWWVWVLIGFILLGLEAATTTLHIGFFGVGAVIVAAAVGAGWNGPLWAQILVFVGSSLILLLFRQPILRLIKNPNEEREIDSLVGETAVAVDPIEVEAIGRAELRGATWSARNVGARPLSAGERCTVARVAGLMLEIRSATPPTT